MSSSVVRRLWVHSFPTTIAYLLIGASHSARLILHGFISAYVLMCGRWVTAEILCTLLMLGSRSLV